MEQLEQHRTLSIYKLDGLVPGKASSLLANRKAYIRGGGG